MCALYAEWNFICISLPMQVQFSAWLRRFWSKMSEQPPADAAVAETVAAVMNNAANIPANQPAPADKYASTPRLFGRKQPVHQVLGGGTSKLPLYSFWHLALMMCSGAWQHQICAWIIFWFSFLGVGIKIQLLLLWCFNLQNCSISVGGGQQK